MRPERVERPHFGYGMRRWALGASLLVAVVTFAQPARASLPAPQISSSPGYDPASFVRELERLKAGLDAAGKSNDALRAYRESLPERWRVNDGSRHYDVPSDPLTSRIAKAERQPEYRAEQLKEAGAYLDALASETAALGGAASASAADAQSKLNGILDRPEFKHTDQETWWSKLRARIDEILLNALDRIFSQVGGQRSLGNLLLWIGLCAAAVLIAYWIFRNWFQSARAIEIALHDSAVPARSWQEWVFAARDAAGRGDYRAAVHCAYWAGIARLQDQGALVADRSKTPRENLRALTRAKTLVPEALATKRDALAHLTTRLEWIWYGSEAATESDFRDSLAQLEILGCRLL